MPHLVVLALLLGLAPPAGANSGQLVRQAVECLAPGGSLGRLAREVSEAERLAQTQAKVAVLFPNAWERRELSHVESMYPNLEITTVGNSTSDLLALAGAAMTGDMVSYFDKLAADLARQNVSAAIGAQDFPSSVFAAEVNSRLGAPSPSVESLLILTNKYHSREAQASVHPDAVPPFQAVDPKNFDPATVELTTPFFVKPVKGTSSAGTAKIEDVSELPVAMKRNTRDAIVHGAFARMYNRILAQHLSTPVNADYFVLEGLLRGDQVTVDGFVHDGQVTIRGVVDSVMYPGTTSFSRFQYPSRMPPEVLDRMKEIAGDVVRAGGLDQSAFNVEFFYDAATGEIKVIEVNPRLAMQFADLYQKVDGVNLFEDAIALATGQMPKQVRAAGPHDVAASFVLRKFPGQKVRSFPSRARYREVQEAHPDWRITLFRYEDQVRVLLDDPKSSLVGYFNIGAADQAELEARYAQVLDELGIVIE